MTSAIKAATTRTRFSGVNFVKSGSVYGKVYGNQRQGTGRMPGFGLLLTDEQITAVVEYVRSL